eukprot:scaffold212557_cov12-Tisochrysis_lutea.AAC.1
MQRWRPQQTEERRSCSAVEHLSELSVLWRCMAKIVPNERARGRDGGCCVQRMGQLSGCDAQ